LLMSLFESCAMATHPRDAQAGQDYSEAEFNCHCFSNCVADETTVLHIRKMPEYDGETPIRDAAAAATSPQGGG